MPAAFKSSKIRWSFLGALAVLGCADIHAQPAGLLFPKGTNLSSLVSIADSSLGSSEQQILLATLQGIVARSSSEQIYIDTTTYSRWRLHLATSFGVPSTTQTDPYAVLTRYRSLVSGYVLYDYANTNSRNSATSLCGPLNGVAVDLSLESAVRARGITNLLADVRSQDEAAVRANYPGLFNRKLVVEQLESFKTHLRDYAVMANAFTFADGNSAFRTAVLAGLDADSALLGWGTGSENTFIGASSDAGVFTVPADFARNLSTLSSVRTPPARQHSIPVPNTDPQVHYVSFLVTDGDNLQWALGDFPDYFNHPLRGSFNMGWALPPSLGDLAPSALQWFYANASNGVGKDFFVAGPSALGYMYPSRYPVGDLEHHTRRLNDFAAFTDLRIAQVIDFNSFNRVDLWSRYTAEPAIDALIYIEYSRYDARGGALLWQNGKPIITPRKMLWTGLSGADEASVTSALNAASHDPFSSAGYSLVLLHVWSKDLTSVQTVINGLSPGVRVVTPWELVRLITTNISAKLSFDFETGTMSWTGATGGKPADRADWVNGSLRLDGSDQGLPDSSPNASFSRLISLPVNATRLRWDTRADGSGRLRVRLRRSNGSFVVLADWNALADQNWHTPSVDLSPFAREDVTIYFEQTDGGNGVNQARYIDNVVVETLGTADVIEPEADSSAQGGSAASTNFGFDPLLTVGTDADPRESFLRFALTNVSGRVIDARLRLTPVTVTGSATNALALVADNTWTESGITWNTRPGPANVLSSWIPSPGAPVEIPVGDAVQSALTNGGRISFQILAPDVTPLTSYASREMHSLYAPRLLVITSNTPPILSVIQDQTTPRNTPITLPFTVDDLETPAQLLSVTALSDNTNLLAPANLMLDGSGAARSITLTPTPNHIGGATVTLIASDGVLTTQSAFLLTVTGINNPPTAAAITSPANGAVFNAPANIPLSAVASDPDGNIVRVDYLLGSTIVGSAYAAPYTFSWTNVPVGTYGIRARAMDDGGLAITSITRQVIVENPLVTLVPAGAIWKYYDVNGVDLGTAWRSTNYNDSTWLSGPAKLGFGDPATTTVNSDPTRITTYFRTRFVVTNVSAITSLIIGVLRDDGAVVYLNSNEVFRSNMPGGTILNNTLASSAISGAEETTWFTNKTASPSLLMNGTNTVAVEVHQGSTSSSDLGFDFLLVAQVGSGPPTPIPLTLHPAPASLDFTWSATIGWNLYTSPLLGPGALWTRVPAATRLTNGQSTVSIAPTQAAAFFQLRQP